MASSNIPILRLQLAGVIGGLALMLFAPPVQGFQLLVPLSDGARLRMLSLAVGHGAQLVGKGPLPGSFVVRGLHAALGAPLAAAGILTLAAPSGGCGTTGDADAQR